MSLLQSQCRDELWLMFIHTICLFTSFLDRMDTLKNEIADLLTGINQKKIEIDKKRQEVDSLCKEVKERINVCLF